jgi:3alpha(or 20beta)-hydroxysteroid dehydrogenase
MEDLMDRLKDKIILITGAARGQGAAEARRCVEEGARVVITDVLESQGRALAAEVGQSAAFVKHDVTSETDWASAIAAARALGGLHGFVNNAGIYQPATLMETDVALFERHVRVNQLGCFIGMKAVVPLMTESGGGSIVNISSTAGLRGSPGAFAYSATKWALRGMTKAAAVDLAPNGIRVNSVHPGPIDTDMLKVRTDEQNAARLQLVPMRRMGTVAEIANLIVFLLSDEARFMTGSEVAIDGGATL